MAAMVDMCSPWRTARSAWRKKLGEVGTRDRRVALQALSPRTFERSTTTQARLDGAGDDVGDVPRLSDQGRPPPLRVRVDVLPPATARPRGPGAPGGRCCRGPAR